MTQAILCSESSADGDMFFLVENEKAYIFYQRVSDITYGNAESIGFWGGWFYDVDLAKKFEGYETVPSKEEHIARLVENGAKIATEEDMKKELVSDDPDLDFAYMIEDIWLDYE